VQDTMKALRNQLAAQALQRTCWTSATRNCAAVHRAPRRAQGEQEDAATARARGHQAHVPATGPSPTPSGRLAPPATIPLPPERHNGRQLPVGMAKRSSPALVVRRDTSLLNVGAETQRDKDAEIVSYGRAAPVPLSS